MSREQRFWDMFARRYSKSKISDETSYKKTLDDTRKFLKKNHSVLEIGCGTGTTALKLADAVKKYTATDLSKNMIAIGKEKAKRHKVNNVVFQQATLFDGKLKENSYDAVMAYNLFHLLKNTPGSIRKVNRLLKPGGLFISKTPCLGEKGSMKVLAFFIRFLIGPITCFTLKEFKKTLAQEGFKIVDEHIYPESPPRIFIVAKKVK